jgi:hypothetical protein
MSFQSDPAYWTQSTKVCGNSITFCSCILDGTKLEQNPTKREIVVMWAKDAAAGAALVLFMVSSFILASGAHALTSHL